MSYGISKEESEWVAARWLGIDDETFARYRAARRREIYARHRRRFVRASWRSRKRLR